MVFQGSRRSNLQTEPMIIGIFSTGSDEILNILDGRNNINEDTEMGLGNAKHSNSTQTCAIYKGFLEDEAITII